MKKNKEITLSVATISSINNNVAANTDAPVTLPPGKYWIGDPFYVMKSKWGTVCEIIYIKLGETNGVIEIEGARLWVHKTAYGDGIYEGLKNSLANCQFPDEGFCVDSGLIGIVPIQLTNGSAKDYSLGTTVTFFDAVNCSYENGLYVFESADGGFLINTSPGPFQDTEYLAIGVDLIHLAPEEQLEMSQYIAGQIGNFAQSSCDGYLGTVNIVSGFLQITVHCEDPDQALTDFISMLESGEIDIPEDYVGIGEGDPVEFMIGMMDEVNGEDFICDDCIKAMKEEEAAQAKKNVKH